MSAVSLLMPNFVNVSSEQFLFNKMPLYLPFTQDLGMPSVSSFRTTTMFILVRLHSFLLIPTLLSLGKALPFYTILLSAFKNNVSENISQIVFKGIFTFHSIISIDACFKLFTLSSHVSPMFVSIYFSSPSHSYVTVPFIFFSLRLHLQH